MEYDVHLPYPGYNALVTTFEHTPLGRQIVSGLGEEFGSASALIGASHVDQGGAGTVVSLLNGNSLDFDNVPFGRFARVVRTVTAYFGGRQ